MKNSKFIYGVKSSFFTWLSGFLLLLFSGTSCSEEENGNSIFTDDVESTVFFEVNTRAFGSGDKQVNAVRVIVARQDYEGTIISNDFFPNPETSTITIKTKSGLCDVFVVANEMDNNTELSALRDVKTIRGLQQINIPYNISNRKATNLPMMGEVRSVFIRSVDGVPSSSNLSKVIVNGVESSFLEVKVSRLAIKVDLTLMSQSFVELESVKITNIPDFVSLVGKSYEAAEGKSQVLEINNWASSTPLEGYIWDKSRNEIYLPSYLFTPLTAAAKAIKLEVKFVGQERAKIVSLGHLMNKKTDYTLHPNTYYSFTGRILGDDFIITAAIKDWDLVEQDYPTGGGKWLSQPATNVRIGINKAVADTAKFEAVFAPGPVSYNWYRKYQIYNPTSNKIETIVQPLSNVESDTLTIKGAYESNLSIATKKISISGEIYCIASTKSPDNTAERSESNRVTLMFVGENHKWPKNSFPSMQSFKTPLNAPLGSTCILQDDREEGHYNAYHVKLMADGNWWMIQDLAYGNTLPTWGRDLEHGEIDVIAPQTHGVAIVTGYDTGGYFYNTFAAVQKSSTDKESWLANVGLPIENVQGLCPQGWHIPGNRIGVYNQEWFDFEEKIDMGYNNISSFTYNSSSSFNCYTPYDVRQYQMAGGYVAANTGKNGPYEYRTNGVWLGDDNYIFTGSGAIETTGGQEKMTIRCIKNFK